MVSAERKREKRRERRKRNIIKRKAFRAVAKAKVEPLESTSHPGTLTKVTHSPPSPHNPESPSSFEGTVNTELLHSQLPPDFSDTDSLLSHLPPELSDTESEESHEDLPVHGRTLLDIHREKVSSTVEWGMIGDPLFSGFLKLKHASQKLYYLKKNMSQ